MRSKGGQNRGVTEAELAEAKKGWLQGQNVSRARDNELAGQLTGFAFEDRDVNFQAELEKKVSALSAQQIVDALRKHLNPERMSFYRAKCLAPRRRCRIPR
jgi:zinc protease